ncbi:Solute carrier family 35 member E2 [Chionoecetes opilio]|uniref:Solute carrier family 35 member E2 n=1 Tax=Chionoecetes opilio TaxID=41210 RepID=A0A8J5D315_CHIOP|nr:Solute carrier family 35 member E2 [Chionoecetes opilio]
MEDGDGGEGGGGGEEGGDKEVIRSPPTAPPDRRAPNPGLRHPRALVFLGLWYVFSGFTLFLNKYILTYQKADPHVLCGLQMFITMVCGAVQMRYPLGTYRPVHGQRKPENFRRGMLLLGMLQLGTIMFGLIAIYYVAVSFAETVKSSAPIFTVIIAWLLLGEKTSCGVAATLVPVMGGLALCSSHELSFSLIGFLCALATNLSECLQSVVSKSLLSQRSYVYSPAELQFYPNLCAVVLQLPAWWFLVDLAKLYRQLDHTLLVAILLDGLTFHGQTITAYVLMSYVNPVTYSVANTTKRACLIWLSVMVFGNPVTVYSWAGTAVVVAGVLLYGQAREREERRRELFSIPRDKMEAGQARTSTCMQ